VAALAVSSTGVFAGGAFTSAGGVPASNLARWGGMHWSPVGGGVSGPVYALVNSTLNSQPSTLNPLYAAGKFTAAGGVTASNIAQWDGTNWTPLGSGLNGTVYALALNSQPPAPILLYAGGAFTNAGVTSVSNVACWNGATWSGLGSGVNGTVYALTVSGSNLFVGGRFGFAGGLAASNVARWDGSTWSALGGGVGGVVSSFPRMRPPPVSALLVNGSDLFVGGDFAFAGGVAATNVARWDGANWSALGPGVLGVSTFSPPPTVRALVIHSTLNSPVSALNPLHVGGTFIKAGGLPMANLARWDGSQWAPVGDGMNSPPPLAALALTPGEMYLGGNFRLAGGKPASDFTIWYSAVRLEIVRAGEAVAVSWPAAADGYALQATATLSPASWQTVTDQPVRLGSQWSVILTNPGPSQFYRLHKP